jgi:hypothetical protein
MPVIQASVSVAANAVNDNVLAGSQFEFAPYNASVNFGLNGDANGGDLRVDVYSGNDMLCEQLVPNSQNRVPVNPDDYILSDVVGRGERIKIRVRNTSAAGARVLFFGVIMTPIG